MAIAQYNLTFNCTPAQFTTAMTVTLPGVGYRVIQAPIKAQGELIANTGASAGTGQCDFSYDGQSFLKFYSGVMSAAMVTELTAALAATLGAPVPSAIAVPPAFVP